MEVTGHFAGKIAGSPGDVKGERTDVPMSRHVPSIGDPLIVTKGRAVAWAP